jgi:hypothetical protein
MSLLHQNKIKHYYCCYYYCMQLGNENLGDGGDEGRGPSSLEPRAGDVVGVERCNWGMHANLGDKGDEGKEPASLGPRACERRWVSRDAAWGCKSWRQG